jgi:hypothetical protein
MSAPVYLEYHGGGEFRAVSKNMAARCDKEFTARERYRMDVIEERSHATHAHYFAALNEAFKSLPDDIADEFPTVDALRKWALIRAGFCDRRSIVCSSNAEANRVKAFVKPMDEFALVMAEGPIVTVYTAKSQSMRAMDKQTFADSKTKVLEVVAGLIGVTGKELAKQRESA